MQTGCISDQLEFEGFERCCVVAAFDGGAMTLDAGALLLRHADRAIGLFEGVASCFEDHRSLDQAVHSVRAMVGQRIAGIALGYEDINDHDELRHDPVLGRLAERLEPARADCAALAGKSTLSRLGNTPEEGSGRYHKIAYKGDGLSGLFVDLFLDADKKPAKRIVLDLEATDDPLHGHQEGRFFHGYYDCYRYLPLYIFCGRHLPVSKLRPANIDASAGAREEVQRLVEHIRDRWPNVKILLRGGPGFAREELMAWCEENRVDYVFGLARNKRLEAKIVDELAKLKACGPESGKPERAFRDFYHGTLKSRSRRRRVVAKAEWLPKGLNPRSIVTSLKPSQIGGRALYEDLYCARGEMENRIKEQQLDLFADRTSAKCMRAHQLRLWLASFAYVLLCAPRRIGPAHSEFANATCGTIRLKLLKIGARVTLSVRPIKIAMASAYPYQAAFPLAHARLSR